MRFFSNQLLVCLSVICLMGCGSQSNKSNNPDSKEASGGDKNKLGLLTAVKTDTQLLESLRQGYNKTIPLDDAPLEAVSSPNLDTSEASSGNRSSSNFTTTYTLEKSVDEHDYVKYDGSHLFIAPSRSMDFCFSIDLPELTTSDETSTSPSVPASPERGIRIVATTPETGVAESVATISLEHDRTVEGLYTASNHNQLISISSSSWWGSYGDSFARVANWKNQKTALDIYDISDPSAPQKNTTIEFDGGFVNSRKKGDIVYIVARHTPSIANYIDYPNAEQKASNKVLLDDLSIEDVLPSVTINGSQTLLVEATDCRITNSDNSFAPKETGYPILTLIVAIDLSSESIAKATCYSEPTEGIYVSETSIYLTQVDYIDSKARTLVHSYELSKNLSYQGSGVAEGSLNLNGTSSNKDFRINEYDGYLRLVTAIYTGNSEDQVDHKLTIMQRNYESLSLETVASLPNSEKPQAIGKPNEQLYGVRFFGKKAYLVTFRQIDPLYVIDLSNPTDPGIVGELEVPGFSDFLHPVNDSLLLGLGQDAENDAENKVKLELFNVGDMSKPTSLGTVILGEKESDSIGLDTLSWSYSEARYNRHAFTYQTYNESTDRFLVPATLGFHSAANGNYQSDSLFLFEINSKDNPATATIDNVGAIKVDIDRDNYWQSTRHRSVIHGDGVFYVHGTKVWSTLWTDPSQENGPE